MLFGLVSLLQVVKFFYSLKEYCEIEKRVARRAAESEVKQVPRART